MSKRYSFDQLDNADLVVNAVYEWGPTISTSHEPLKELLSVRSTGGFRPKKRRGGKTWEYAFVVLYSTGSKEEWPDNIDPDIGLFTYFGDNKKPNSEWDKTPGNRILEYVFRRENLIENRETLYPFFFFTIVPNQRHAQFRGLAVPGHPSVSADDALTITENLKDGIRFQNYRGVFSLLNIPIVSRSFIEELLGGEILGRSTPQAWKDWVENGEYNLLPSLQIIPRRIKINAPISEVKEEVSLNQEVIISQIKELDDRESGESRYRNLESKQYVRRSELAKLIRQRFGDICQICGDSYHSEKGAYCDTHHVVPLSEGGTDTSDNIMVVCPNCHRKFDLTDVEVVDRGKTKSVIVPWIDENEEIEYWHEY